VHYQGSFEVSAPREKVYAFVTDPKKVTTIFPDASDVKVVDENNFSAKVKVGMSFIRGTLDVKMNMVEKKPGRFAKLKARGTGLSSSVDLESSFTLEDGKSGGTVLSWVADAKISGMMASVGSRLMDSAAEKYVNQIVTALKKKLSD
jgi:carbon monoxide dehydrogenase subunit G